MTKTKIIGYAAILAMVSTFFGVQPSLAANNTPPAWSAKTVSKTVLKVKTPAKASKKSPAQKSPVKVKILYTELVIQRDPIVLSGNQVLEINKLHYVLLNTITLKDNAQLIIKDSFFEQRNASSSVAVMLNAQNQSQVSIKNSILDFSPAINWDFTDRSSLALSNISNATEGSLSPVWNELSGYATVNVNQAVFHGSIADQANLTIDKSPDVQLNLGLRTATVLDEMFPRYAPVYTFPGNKDQNVTFKFRITNSTISLWGLTIAPQSSITLRDTGAVNLGLMLAKPLTGATITLDGLTPTKFADKVFDWGKDIFKIHLINTTVTSWSPIVGDDNNVTIANSEITEQRWHWGNAKITLDNSTAFMLRAKDNVQIVAKNSKITSDVVASGNGQITLIHTKVLGKKISQDNGQILVQE